MAKKYVDELTKIIEKTLPKLKNIEINHFFNGAAVYANGKICITLTPVGFAIKLPAASRTELMKDKEVKYLLYFSKGHIKKEYIVLTKKILDDKKLLRRLIKESLEYVN